MGKQDREGGAKRVGVKEGTKQRRSGNGRGLVAD